MTAMLVLYARRTGQTLGAATTTVSGDVPSLDGLVSVRVSVPIPDPPNGTVLVPAAAAAPPPPPPPPRPLIVERDDLSLVQVEAEFDDPLQVFAWRVVVETAPDGTRKPRLDRLATGAVTATRTATDLTFDVPRLGNAQELAFEVRNAAGLLHEGRLVFTVDEPKKSHTVTVPDEAGPVVMVEGYPPVVAKEGP
jgi:hypothetical protein